MRYTPSRRPRSNGTSPSPSTRLWWKILLPILVILSSCAVNLVMSILVMGSEKYPVTSKSGKICIGTNGRMSVPSNREHHYQNLRDRYTNCTYVDGNLELTWLQDKNMDLSFLQDIREVTGYVLISHVDVKKIVIPNLQIIRGRTLFKLNVRDEEFALMVTLSKMENLEMPALRDVLVGSVGFFNNYNLCHIRTINWEEILSGPKAKTIYVYNFTQPERECPPCDSSCEDGCWGEGPHNCQKFSKTNCSPQCHQGRCFGSNPRECCHLFCAGGCTGPKQSDCLACRNFNDDGVCKQECPPMMKYNPSTYSWEVNPEGKYAYGATCVKVCPDHLLKDNGACVRSCPPNKKNNNRGECVPCDGPCPKNCQGVDVVHADNIDSFRECTIIEGSLTILDTSFEGYQEVFPNFTFGLRHPRMDPDRLEVFSTLKQVTGYVSIQASHPDFKNLSYFRNLEEIGGRQLTEYFSALYIVKTSLVSLNLRSLKTIRSGSVAILENKDLCFAKTVDWNSVRRSNSHSLLLSNNSDDFLCRAKGLTCHPECGSDGCWGPGPAECLSCRSYRLGDTCIDRCNTSFGIYDAGGQVCKHCHEECLGECFGPGPSNCSSCRHVRDGPFCVKECPVSKYNDGGECKPCHENCVGGCTGPNNTIGKDGCVSCEKAMLNPFDPNVVEQCLKADESCPDGFYHEYISPQEEGTLKALTGKSVCRKCHSRCKNCTAYGFHTSICECLRYSSGEQCEDSCARDHYADESNHRCVKCADECRGCTGPGNGNCLSCRNYKVYLDEEDGREGERFNCTASCPSEKPFKVFDDPSDGPYCSDKDTTVLPSTTDNDDQWAAVIGGIVACILIIVAFFAIFSYQWLQRAKSKENTMRLTMKMTGFEDNEPLRVTNIKPNLAKLRVIKEQDLSKGGVLGFGAFGTVYKGFWIAEEKKKIPVAIKVLREGSEPSMSQQFLEEAYIMASVDHPNLLKLLAVCMTSELMLVTQLMPLGCLLTYVRTNRSRIGSVPLLNWCTQMARGMAYLEEKRMVHRDLALRNVLLYTPGCVKITDFGLAKLLDIDEDEYTAAGGKMPIKWLAPECIQHRKFTHKSDVWAFGVTMWELFTFGERPYEKEGISAREVLTFLLSGQRLAQPEICTIEVYMIMFRCWWLEPETRGSFKEMAEQLAKMASDPGRFLVIKGDKFLRLPAYTRQDAERELINMLAVPSEGQEEIVDAEEYFEEQFPRDSNKNDSPPPPTPIKKFMDARGFQDLMPYHASTASTLMTDHHHLSHHGNSHHHHHLDGRSSVFLNTIQRNGSTSTSASHPNDPHHLHHRHTVSETPPVMYSHHQYPQHSRGGSLSSGRICLDTLKYQKGDDSVFLPVELDPAVNKSMAVRLPVDEDDYLLPSPQHMGSSMGYMDLIDGKSTHSGGTMSVSGYNFIPLNARSRMGLDNLEYHLMSREYGHLPPHEYINTSSGPVPVTMAPTMSTANGTVSAFGVAAFDSATPCSSHTIAPLAGTQVIHIVGRKMSTERSSSDTSDDHDYYNEMQRELQPLHHRPNETTV